MSTEQLFRLVLTLVFIILLVGGIGMLLAWSIRLLSGRPARRSPRSERACPVCQTPKRPEAFECSTCGWARHTHAGEVPQRIAVRQIIELHDSGLIDGATFQAVLNGLDAQKRAQGAGPVLQAPTTVPVPESSPIAKSTDTEPGGTQPSAKPAEDVIMAEIVPVEPATAPPAAGPTQAAGPATPTPDIAQPTESGVASAKPVAPKIPQAPVADRVREYAVRRQEPMEPPLQTPPPRVPRKPWSDVFAAFMEEKHIRWGELVGGLLIVSCSIALVISFWSQIAEKPILQFGLFNGVTAALFGLGLHAAKRWKLPTTSQGLLITAMLLVPLNFLAMAAFAEGSAQSSPVAIVVGEVVSVVGFAALTYFAAQVVVPNWPIAVTIGVLGQCLVVLLVRRFVSPETSLPTLYLITSSSLLAYAAANGWTLKHTLQDAHISGRRGNEVFKMLGISTFAACLPLSLLLFKSKDVLPNLRLLAPLASLVALPSLAAGLLVWRRANQESSGMRTAGTSVAIAGAGVLIAGLVLSWPQPATMLPSALVVYLSLAAIALWFRIPEAHLAAGLGGALAYLLTCLLVAKQVGWTDKDPTTLLLALSSGFSGNVLTGLVALFGLATWGYKRLGQLSDANAHSILAAATAVVSLALITWRGFAQVEDPLGATWVYALYAVIALVVAWHVRHWLMTSLGGGLLLVAVVQGVVYRFNVELEWQQPWIAALLLQAGVVSVGAAVAQFVRPSPNAAQDGDRVLTGDRAIWGRAVVRNKFWADPLMGWAQVTSVLALLVLLAQAGGGYAKPQAVFVCSAAIVWLIVSCIRGSQVLFSLFQLALTVSLILAVDERLALREWYADVQHGWLQPYSLQAQGIAVASLSLAWLAFRAMFRQFGMKPGTDVRHGWKASATWLLYPAWPSVDTICSRMVVVLLALMSVYAVVPGMAQELSPQTEFSRTRAVWGTTEDAAVRNVPAAELFEFDQFPHVAAMGWGAWLLCGLSAVVLIAGLRERFSFSNLSALVIVAASICLLLAARWDADVAVASALRWYTAGLFGLGSVIIWLREPLLGMTGSRFWPRPEIKPAALSRNVFSVLVFLAVAPLVAMAAFVAIAAVGLNPPSAAELQGLRGLAVVFIAAVVLWLVLSRFKNSFGSVGQPSPLMAPGIRHAGNILLVLGAAPLLAMSLFVVATALMQHPVVGPEPDSFFAYIGLASSYALPLLVIAGALIGHAMSQRSAGLALTAGLVLNFCATAAYLLSGVAVLDTEMWLRLAQLNSIVSGAFAIGWIVYLRLRVSRTATAASHRGGNLLVTQVGLATGFALLFIVPVTARMFWDPNSGFTWDHAAGFWGWSAVALAAISISLLRSLQHADAEDQAHAPLSLWATGLLAVIVLVACEADRWDAFGNWLAYHTLLSLTLIGGFTLLGVAIMFADRDRAACWTSLFLAGTVLMSLRAIGGDPGMPWWSVGGLAASAVLSALLAGWARRQRFVYAAGILCNVAASIWWIDQGYRLIGSDGIAILFEFVQLNVVVLVLPVVLWLWLDRRWIAKRSVPARVIGFHRLATAVALYVLMATVGLSVFSDAIGESVEAQSAFGWLALVTVLIGIVACLWDGRAKWSVVSLYVAGLVSVVMFVDQFDLPRNPLVWTGAMALAAYSVGTSYLWSRRSGLMALAERLQMPRQTDLELAGQSWLVPTNSLLTIVVIVLGYWAQFVMEEFSMRISAAQAVIAQAFAVGMLARGAKESQLRVNALWIGVIGTVAFGWSWLDPERTGNLLNRIVVVNVGFVAMAVFYGLGLSKLIRRENQWTRAAQQLVPTLAVLALCTIGVVLGAEVVLYVSTGAAAMEWPAIVAVAVTLVGLAVASLLAAIVPGRDPLGLSERRRTIYVYAAEALLALLFLHIRLTMSWLFIGFFQQFWPLIVMLIAFLGVGLSEWFHRRQRMTLADPLEKTGALLPMLPVFVCWAAPTEVHFSLLMLTVGVFYGGLSVMRRSFGFSILAALAVNGSLWYLLQQTQGLSILEHPQIWLIPPSLCILVAAYLNRESLTEAQMTSIRYLTSTVIYTASTADILVNGVAEAPWLALVLAGLAIVGILAGIMLRVRGFLFLGTAFLTLALFTVIWYAAVDLKQTWLWYLTGIVAGALIIAMFAVFEKKRQQILQLMDQLKQWHA